MVVKRGDRLEYKDEKLRFWIYSEGKKRDLVMGWIKEVENGKKYKMNPRALA